MSKDQVKVMIILKPETTIPEALIIDSESEDSVSIGIAQKENAGFKVSDLNYSKLKKLRLIFCTLDK